MKVGNFDVDVWGSGYPVWILIKHNGQELKFTHGELADLEYVMKKARIEATKSLPEKYRAEIG